MNRDQARLLITQTFTRSFDKVRFGNFAVNLLNRIDESKAKAWNSQYVKDAFKKHVHRYERLGTYTSPDNEKLDILIVHLTNEYKLEHARTAIRNFVADHLKTRDEKDAALVAFVSPTESQWRFSYVKMEYSGIELESGKVGVERRLTPARRFSYIVGEGESCHTAQTRFLGLLEDTDTDPTLAKIEEAFSVEAVTTEFFTKYAELFEEIHKALDRLVAKDKTSREEFNAKGVKTVDFAKKLMGQIVFLYFLQKKGWLGVAEDHDWGTGPRDFLRKLANGDYGKSDNFFNDILEPLFYDTLATDRGHEAWCNRFNCRIPFLNGGLFEPLGDYDWRKIDIILPSKLFTNKERFDEGITGTGVLDVFDRYNFTVNEAEPLEQEVAIDPEMLGKVFENLIEENLRKGLGSYYTPREIVHFMCQESLINYLDTALNGGRETVARADIETFVHLGEQYSFFEAAKQAGTIGRDYPKPPKSIEQHARLIDEKLADITVCDPAVGSGAFPVGMMAEIVRGRSALTPYFNDVHERTAYHFKRHAIQTCLYGVDIDPGAVEIAKLRLWLSLVVDEEETKQIKPLPNLDYKIVAGNSLIGFPFKSEKLVEIEKLKATLFDESDSKAKAQIKREVQKKINECFASSKKSLGYEVNFDIFIYFSEVFHSHGGFDVAIANPPYIEFKKLDQSFKDVYNLTYRSAKGKYDIYVLFVELSHGILRASGHMSFINPTMFLKKDYGSALRALIAEHFVILQIFDFADLQIFEGVTNYTGLFFFRKQSPGDYTFFYHKYKRVSSELDGSGFSATLELKDSGFRKDVVAISGNRLHESTWDFHTGRVTAVLDKMRMNSSDLSVQTREIFQGIASGKDEVFYVDEATIRQHKIETSVLYPLLKGQNLKRYAISWSGYSVIYPYDEDSQVIPEDRLRRSFPHAYDYLRHNRTLLAGRGYFEKSTKNWYELWNQRKRANFHALRIVTPEISDRNNFALTDTFFGNTKTYHIILDGGGRDDYLFYLGVLNSCLIEFFYQSIASRHAGGFFAYKTQFLEKIPIRKPSEECRKSVIRLVNRILTAKKRDPDADTTAAEAEIDRQVFELYGLTSDEIKLVEESGRK